MYDSYEGPLVCTYIRNNEAGGRMDIEKDKVFYFTRLCKNYSKNTEKYILIKLKSKLKEWKSNHSLFNYRKLFAVYCTKLFSNFPVALLGARQ